MNFRERIMAASRGQAADQLPFFHYWRHSQIGWTERECRNRGMGMNWVRPCYTETNHGVEVSERRITRDGKTQWQRTYETPVGSVSCVEIREAGVGQWHPQRSWLDVSPWQTERLIKEPEDYAVVQYMVENTEYEADYFPIEQAADWLGDDGVVLSGLPHSPMQMLMIDWVGSEGGRIFYHLEDMRDTVEALYRALCRSREPLYDIAARAPADIVLCGDNVDGYLVTPKLFEQYFAPVYEVQARVLHAEGKLMAVHMDGRLATLKELIAQTDIDIVEAVHPPPMGDLRLGEALAAWPGKSIWVGFPGSVCSPGTDEAGAFAAELLEEMGTGERLAVAMSTENLVSNDDLLAVTSVLARAELPLMADMDTRN